jgi:molecular chaperone GrpE
MLLKRSRSSSSAARSCSISCSTSATPSSDAGAASADVAGASSPGAVSDDGVAEVEQEIEHDLAALLEERDRFKNIALRLQADFENYRKRADRQIAEEADRATGRVMEDLLTVLDACEAAFTHGVEEVEPIWSQLLGVLQRHGLEVMDPLGKPFDPAEQEAVMHEPGEGGEPIVAEVLRTGYRWKGKVLRAAMVKVKG